MKVVEVEKLRRFYQKKTKYENIVYYRTNRMNYEYLTCALSNLIIGVFHLIIKIYTYITY